MIRLFLRVLAAFLGLIGIVLLIGALLPRRYELEARIQIDAPPKTVFPYINRLENWEHWSPISESIIDNLTVEYQGAAAGEGAVQVWEEPRGKGKMWITRSEPFELIEYKWRFASFPELEGEFRLQTSSQSEDAPGRQVSFDYSRSRKMSASRESETRDPVNPNNAERRKSPASATSTATGNAIPGGKHIKTTGEKCVVIWRSRGRLPAGPFYGWFGLFFESALSAEYRKSLERLKRYVEER